MKSWKGWLALLGAFYLFFLVWMVPAGLLWGWWAARPDSGAERVALVDLRGPWSAGSCALLRVGPLQLTDLTWRLRPLALLRGRLEFAVAALADSGRVDAVLGLGRHTLELRGLRWQGPAAPIGRMLVPGVEVTGSVDGQNLRLLLAKGLPVEAAGQLTWRGAGLALTTPVTLGDLALEVQTTAQGITASLKDRGGPLRIEVQAGLKADGAYEINGELAPRGKVPPDLGSLLGLLGPAAPDGRLRLARSGRLAPLY